MTKALNEIAHEIEEAANALVIMARGIAGPGNEDKAEARLYTEEGKLIDLRALAADIRRHAADKI